uniref:RNase H type-1 domain-containing protein n=1 Tax=Cannabis sativa TaxID=3483 RepID=A0A803PM90_CANSA
MEAAATWDDAQYKLAIMLCWSIWQARNDKVWKGISRQTQHILALARGNLNQWCNAQERTFVPSQLNLKPNEGGELWMKPIGNTIKVNVDASIFEDQNRYGFGWVARNNEGRLLWAKNGSRWGKVSAEFAEAMGLKEVLSWLKESNLSNVVVESDSLVTIQAIRSSISFCSTFGFCISECQRLISSLSNVDVCFVKRSANRVAHQLARASFSLVLIERFFSIYNPNLYDYGCVGAVSIWSVAVGVACIHFVGGFALRPYTIPHKIWMFPYTVSSDIFILEKLVKEQASVKTDLDMAGCERLTYYVISTNLVTYLMKKLHERNVSAARNGTTWGGTCYLAPLTRAIMANAYGKNIGLLVASGRSKFGWLVVIVTLGRWFEIVAV